MPLANALPLFVAVLFFLLSVSLYAGCVIVLSRRVRKGRNFIKKDYKVSRQPGESVFRDIDKLNEALEDEFWRGALFPFGLCAGLIVLASTVPLGAAGPWVFGVVGIGYLVMLGYRVRRVWKLVKKRRELRMGWMGERVVAEELSELYSRQDFHIFHDVPAEGANGPFNLDHVVVGPPGVYVIETKARWKAEIEEGQENHKVRYDGTALYWPKYPNFPDKDPVEQAARNAKWLKAWLTERLGLDVPIFAYLVIPGWYVDGGRNSTTAQPSVKCLPSTGLADKFGHTARIDAKQVDLIRRQLASLVRNVEAHA